MKRSLGSSGFATSRWRLSDRTLWRRHDSKHRFNRFMFLTFYMAVLSAVSVEKVNIEVGIVSFEKLFFIMWIRKHDVWTPGFVALWTVACITLAGQRVLRGSRWGLHPGDRTALNFGIFWKLFVQVKKKKISWRFGTEFFIPPGRFQPYRSQCTGSLLWRCLEYDSGFRWPGCPLADFELHLEGAGFQR